MLDYIIRHFCLARAVATETNVFYVDQNDFDHKPFLRANGQTATRISVFGPRQAGVSGSPSVLGLLDFPRHTCHFVSELRGTVDGGLGIHSRNRLPHRAARKENSVNMIDFLGQVRGPISREDCRNPEQITTPNEPFLRRSNRAVQDPGSFGDLVGLIETELEFV